MTPVIPPIAPPNIDTAYLRLQQARGQAYWIIDRKWPADSATHAIREVNAAYTIEIENIVSSDDVTEEKVRKLHLLISKIRSARDGSNTTSDPTNSSSHPEG